jgi:hypothetical protein
MSRLCETDPAYLREFWKAARRSYKPASVDTSRFPKKKGIGRQLLVWLVKNFKSSLEVQGQFLILTV